MRKLLDLGLDLLKDQHFDCLAVGVLDFNNNSYKAFELSNKRVISPTPYQYFDLASLTKPLTLGSAYLIHPELFNDEMKLLLDHRGGLPAWGRISNANWKEQIRSYQIKEADTLYSDFSALRLMLELEEKSSKPLKELCSVFWDKELLFWNELPKGSISPATGERGGREIKGVVNDDNAFIINDFCSHAGLFGTISGLAKSVLKLNKDFSLIKTIVRSYKPEYSDRFICGWDRVMDVNNSLAGKGAGPLTFGHLGFTGTSIWIDPDKMLGTVILTNATRDYCYDRSGLNKLRQSIGNLIWEEKGKVI